VKKQRLKERLKDVKKRKEAEQTFACDVMDYKLKLVEKDEEARDR